MRETLPPEFYVTLLCDISLQARKLCTCRSFNEQLFSAQYLSFLSIFMISVSNFLKAFLAKVYWAPMFCVFPLQNSARTCICTWKMDNLLLQRLGWLPVDSLFHRYTCNMVWKSNNGLARDNLCQIFSRLYDFHDRVLRNTKCDLAIPLIRTAYGRKFICFLRNWYMEQPS